MTAELAVFVVVAIYATTAAPQVEEFSQDSDESISSFVQGPVRKTELINFSNVEITFRQQDVITFNDLHMVAIPEGSAGGHPIGVKMDKGQKYFYKITRFGVEMEYNPYKPDLARMTLIVLFQSEGRPDGLFEVPVLQVPTQRPRRAWPGLGQVGTISPVSVQQLNKLHNSKELTIGFQWLSQLLTHGVRKATMGSRGVGDVTVKEWFRTRPLLLGKDIIQKLRDEVEHFRFKPTTIPPSQRGNRKAQGKRPQHNAMRAVLTVFVIVAIHSITAGPQVKEFSYFVDFDFTHEEEGAERKTELINHSNVKIQFRQQDVMTTDALHMVAVSEEGSLSGKSIGVKMDDGLKYFYKITRFGVEMQYFSNNPNLAQMQIIVFFQSSGKPNVLVEVPVFQVPAPQRRSCEWPGKERVGTLSPVSVQQLNELHSSKELTIGFEWLSQLLNHGVKEKDSCLVRRVGDDTVDEWYVTRPLLLPNNIIQKLMDEVEHFKVKTTSAERKIEIDQSYVDHLNARCGRNEF